MGRPTTDPWVTCFRPRPAARLRLVCFPYAGGAATVYKTWADRLPPTIELLAVQLPGRASRLSEAPLRRLGPLVDAVDGALDAYRDRPLAYFGHSMGAVIAYELAQRLRRERAGEPVRLFVSGRRAPHLPDPHPPTHLLSEADFVAELRRLNGTPPQVLEHPELMQLMVPILRADFEVCETHAHAVRPPLSCPLSVFGGTRDEDATPEELAGWREHTTGPYAAHAIDGDHFFLHTAEARVVSQVVDDLALALGAR